MSIAIIKLSYENKFIQVVTDRNITLEDRIAAKVNKINHLRDGLFVTVGQTVYIPCTTISELLKFDFPEQADCIVIAWSRENKRLVEIHKNEGQKAVLFEMVPFEIVGMGRDFAWGVLSTKGLIDPARKIREEDLRAIFYILNKNYPVISAEFDEHLESFD